MYFIHFFDAFFYFPLVENIHFLFMLLFIVSAPE